MTIGQLSDRTNVPVETIRYYERRDLIPEPSRRPSGYRDYEPEDADRLLFIRRAQRLGFTLNEIDLLLDLRRAGDVGAVRAHAAERLAALDEEIETLTRRRDRLAGLIAACPGAGPAGACPILTKLEGAERKAGTP